MVLPSLKEEKDLISKGFKYIVGIDEVGRGSWAGPLVAAGVIFPAKVSLPHGLADSKLITPKKREILAKIIKEISLGFYISEINVTKIDKSGIGKATQVAFLEISKKIQPSPDFLLIDAFNIKTISKDKQKAIISGDKISASIAAASIIAKVYRDGLMNKLSFKFPNYGFEKHKGYGTRLHQEKIKRYGLSEVHRKSFKLKFLE